MSKQSTAKVMQLNNHRTLTLKFSDISKMSGEQITTQYLELKKSYAKQHFLMGYTLAHVRYDSETLDFEEFEDKYNASDFTAWLASVGENPEEAKKKIQDFEFLDELLVAGVHPDLIFSISSGDALRQSRRLAQNLNYVGQHKSEISVVAGEKPKVKTSERELFVKNNHVKDCEQILEKATTMDNKSFRTWKSDLEAKYDVKSNNRSGGEAVKVDTKEPVKKSTPSTQLPKASEKIKAETLEVIFNRTIEYEEKADSKTVKAVYSKIRQEIVQLLSR